MKENEKNPDRKQERRQKIDKNRKKNTPFYNDEDIINSRLKKEFKKTKEKFDDEEWEDWDKYYNR